jgi:hypothetical protein
MRFTDHATSLYPQKLALTSPTSGGRSVGIVRSRTKARILVLLSSDSQFPEVVIVKISSCSAVPFPDEREFHIFIMGECILLRM